MAKKGNGNKVAYSGALKVLQESNAPKEVIEAFKAKYAPAKKGSPALSNRSRALVDQLVSAVRGQVGNGTVSEVNQAKQMYHDAYRKLAQRVIMLEKRAFPNGEGRK